MISRSDEPVRNHEKLLDLLVEYSRRLREIATSYHQRKSRALFLGLMVYLFLIPLIPFMYLLVVPNEFEPSLWSSAAKVAIGIGAFSAALVTVLTTSYYSEIRRSRFEMLPLLDALKKLTHRASQLGVHSVQDPDEGLMFDLRLAEADAALEYARWAMSSFIFSPFTNIFSPFTKD